ncbi:MAG: hypothetical protein M1294_07135 [Firmicutes bacterium]|jgi:hypothetical protein|nr:hypothetical protein [Bacillota bacterium]MCL5015936.1 hypothetical protein [Bacillota bacterium]HBQ95120.1 hypothetical protein [Sulfobacillus sp.]
MAVRKGSSRQLVIMLMTATLLTSIHHAAPSETRRISERLLAYSQIHSDRPVVYTIELSQDTAISRLDLLQAGTTIRLAGTIKGHTISARRIDVLRLDPS